MSVTKRQRNKPREEHWTKLVRTMMQTDAWRALPSVAQALYPWLKFEWRGPNVNNNGRIMLSVRQAADRLNVTPETARKAFHALQAKGFLVVVTKASLGCEGEAKATEYEITELPLRYAEKPVGRRLYLGWQPGADFPVQLARANNPSGKNRAGKTKSQPRKYVDTNLKIMSVSP